MSVPATEFIDGSGRAWEVQDYGNVGGELAPLSLGDPRASGRVFTEADEMRVYFFAPEDERAPLEDFLALQLRSALR